MVTSVDKYLQQFAPQAEAPEPLAPRPTPTVPSVVASPPPAPVLQTGPRSVDDRLIDALIHTESGGNPYAVNSRSGAQGAAQAMPATAADPGFGVAPLDDPFDPVQARRFAKDYLGAMLERYGGDTRAALAAYNWGPGKVDAWLRDGADPRELPAETRAYVSKIMGMYSDPRPIVDAAASKKPDSAAQEMAMARKLGVPAETVAGSPELAQVALTNQKFGEVMASPGPKAALAQLYGNGGFAAVAHDVPEQVRDLERQAAGQSWWELTKTLPLTFVAGAEQFILGTAEMLQDISPVALASEAAEQAQEYWTGEDATNYYEVATQPIKDAVHAVHRASASAIQESMDAAGPSLAKRTVASIAASAGPMIVGALSTVATANPAIGRTVMSVGAAGQSYANSVIDPNATFLSTWRDAAFQGTLGLISSYLPMGALAKAGGKSVTQVGLEALKTGAYSGVGEAVTEVAQIAYDAGVVGEEMTWGEARDRLIIAGLAGFATGNFAHVAAEPVRRIEQRRVERLEAEAAVNNQKFYEGVAQKAAATGLYDRSPEHAVKMVAKALETHGAPDTLELHVDGIDQLLGEKAGELWTSLGYTAEQVTKARETGTSLPISHEQWARSIASRDDMKDIQLHVRTDHEAMTPAEAEQFQKDDGLKDAEEIDEADIAEVNASEEAPAALGLKVEFDAEHGARYIIKENGGEIGVIDVAQTDNAVNVIWIGDRAGTMSLTNTLGTAKVRNVLMQLKALVPGAKLIKGNRTTGAREAAAKPAMAELDISKLKAPQMLTLAQEQIGLQAMIASAKEIGMTPLQFQHYQESWASHHDKASKRAELNAAKQALKENTAAWKAEREAVRESVKGELEQERVYRALALAVETKLDRALVEAALKEVPFVTVDDLPRQGRRSIVTGKGEAGADPQDLADYYGYDSVHEMLQDMWRSRSLEQAIEFTTDRQMMLRHGDLHKAGQTLRQTIKALMHDDSVGLIVQELNALKASLKDKSRPLSAAKLLAEGRRRIEALQVKEVQTGKFLTDAARAGKTAGKLFRAQGDRTKTYQAKFQQALNMAMARESIKVEDKLETMSRKLRKWARTDRGSIKKLDPDIRAELDNLLGTVDLSDKAIGKMTVGDLRAMYEEAKALVDIGREDLQGFRASEKVRLERLADTAAEGVRTNLVKRSDELHTAMERTKDYGRSFILQTLNMDAVASWIDGKDMGPFWQMFKRPMDEALPKYHDAKVEMGKKWEKIWKPYSKKEMAQLYKENITIDGYGKISRNKLIKVLLTAGNRYGEGALIEGKQITEAQLKALRMGASKRDLDTVQAIHDLYDSYWPQIVASAKERRIPLGRKVSGDAYETSHGTYRGGYDPIRYDRQTGWFAPAANAAELIAEHQVPGKFFRNHTARGFMLARKQYSGQPLRLELNDVYHHMSRVLYDLHLGKPTTEAYNILNQPEFQRALRDTGNHRTADYLKQWVDHAITGEVHFSDWDQVIRRVKANFTGANLAFSIPIALMQPNGILQGALDTGPVHAARAMRAVMNPANWFGDGKIFNVINRKSDVMRQRGGTYAEQELQYSRLLKPTFVGKWTPGKTAEWVNTASYWMMVKAQRMADYVTWQAGYSKAIAEGLSEKDAIAAADFRVKRTQGSREFTDKTPVERGALTAKQDQQNELVRSFTPLVNYMAAKWSLMFSKLGNTSFKTAPLQAFLTVMQVAVFGVIADAVLTALERAALLGEQKDRQGRVIPLWEQIAWNVAGNVGSGPLVREAVSIGQGFSGGGIVGALSDDLGRFIETTAKQVKTGKVKWKDVKKNQLPLISDLTGLPKATYNSGGRIYTQMAGPKPKSQYNLLDEYFR